MEARQDGGINRRMITLSIMLATIIQTIDTTIANVALPHMQGSLSAAQDQITWVLTSYIVASAISTPLTGWVCDRFGQRNVFLVAIAGFTFSSALCGLSESLAQIVLARVLQGVFGASLVPLSQAVLMDINPREKQGSAMAIWGMGVMVGPIIGPTLGGWLTDSYDWRWVFFINVPVGALAFFGIWKYIRYVPGRRSMGFDVFGFASLSLAIGALQMLLDRGERNDWFSSLETWLEAVVFVVSFTYFLIHTVLMPAGKSFFDYRLLRNRDFVTGLFFMFVVGMVLYSVRTLTPTFLQNLMHYPAQTTGWVMAPSGVGTMISMLIVGRIVGHVDLRGPVFIGLSLTAFSLWQMSGYPLDISTSDSVWPGLIQGIGLGLVFVPLSTAAFATLLPELRPQGTAIYSLVRNIGSSLGISLVQTLLVRNTQIAHASLVEHIDGSPATDANPAFYDPAVASAYNLATPDGLAALNAEITTQAAMIAYVDDFRLMLVLTLLMLPLLLLIRTPKARASTRTEPVVME